MTKVFDEQDAYDRDRFCAVVASGPILRGDAIVILGGEDGLERAEVGAQLFVQNAAPVLICSGGVHQPEQGILNGAAMAAHLMAKGIAPDRILVEHGSQNTREQAVNILEIVTANNWTRVILVASNYHIYRAFLTFLRALMEVGLEKGIQLVPMPASNLPWFGKPTGNARTRLELLVAEFEKIDLYLRHVASYREGLAYLEFWEGK